MTWYGIFESNFQTKNTASIFFLRKIMNSFLCEDHDACVNALQLWAYSEALEAETRIDEYRALVRELREEITQVMEATQSRQLY